MLPGSYQPTTVADTLPIDPSVDSGTFLDQWCRTITRQSTLYGSASLS